MPSGGHLRDVCRQAVVLLTRLLAVGSSFTGCAFGGVPGAQWTRSSIYDYRVCEHLAYAYETIVNVVSYLLFAVPDGRL